MRVTDYRVFWNITLEQGSLELHLENGSQVILTADEPGKLIVWIDLLREESPVFYYKTEDGERLASGWNNGDEFPANPNDTFLHDGQG